MPTQDTSKLKERILSLIRIHGPSIPSSIATEIQNSILFTSVFLSELLSEKKLKISNMKVGNSPIYFIPGQEPQLEKFGEMHLKSKEKDAFFLLKEKSFLKDVDQDPAIRVALRAIKDFAIPFKKEEDVFWRYFKISEEESQPKENEPQPEKKESEISEDNNSSKNDEVKENNNFQNNIREAKRAPLGETSMRKDGNNLNSQEKKPLDIFEKEEHQEKIKQKETESKKKKTAKKKTAKKTNEKFFNKVKEYLTNQQIEISDIIGFSKDDLTLKIIENNQEKLLIAYNKKTIKEDEILKAYKKASELNLPYVVFSLGEPMKKLKNLIQAIQNLDKIEKIQD